MVPNTPVTAHSVSESTRRIAQNVDLPGSGLYGFRRGSAEFVSRACSLHDSLIE